VAEAVVVAVVVGWRRRWSATAVVVEDEVADFEFS
jgi:hypothetical protein